MRWPFFFGRASAAKESSAPQKRGPLREWASLPAIQRVVEGPRLTAATAAFVDSLAGTHEPDLSLEPLGHHVSLEGPPGLVTGLARSVESYAASSELVGRPRPRREASVQRRAIDPEEEVLAPWVEEVVEGRAAPDPVQTSFTVVDEPVQVRPPLTRMADSEVAAVLRQAMRGPTPAAAAAPVHERAALEAAPEPSSRPVAVQRLTLGQSRRLGLGAPLSPQRAAAVQRAAETPSLDLAPPPRQPRADLLEVPASPELEAVMKDEGAAPMTAAPVERVASISDARFQGAASDQASGVPLAPDLPLARQAATGAAESAPALGHAVIQRVVARPLPPLYSRALATPTAPIAGDRPPLLTLRRTVDSAGALSGATTPETVQPLPGASGGVQPLLAPRDQMQPAATPIDVGEARLAPAAGIRSLPPLAPLAATVQRVPVTSQDFVAYSPFVLKPAPHAAQRATTVIDVPVQREVAVGEAPAAEPSAATVPVAAAAASAGAGGAEAPGQSDKDLDELARKLHDRISLHLRRDLLIQRERAGTVIEL